MMQQLLKEEVVPRNAIVAATAAPLPGGPRIKTTKCRSNQDKARDHSSRRRCCPSINFASAGPRSVGCDLHSGRSTTRRATGP